MHNAYTAGYSGRSPRSLLATAEQLGATVIDIRYRPQSMIPGFARPDLQRLLGLRYVHLPALGNANYRGGPIEIADMRGGVNAVLDHLAERPAILLCGCRELEGCHRKTVSDALKERGASVDEVAWSESVPDGAMLALTLWQPWASLIAWGEKRYETRSWATGYRGPIAIHAAKKWSDDQEWTAFALGPIRDVCERNGAHFDAGTRGHSLPLGSVVATAKLSACVPAESLADLSDDEREFGNFGPGRWAWRLDGVCALPDPIPARGAQGIWAWRREAEGSK